MAYDPYMNAEYGANQGTAAHHPVGLGIQYVRSVLNECHAHLT